MLPIKHDNVQIFLIAPYFVETAMEQNKVIFTNSSLYFCSKFPQSFEFFKFRNVIIKPLCTLHGQEIFLCKSFAKHSKSLSRPSYSSQPSTNRTWWSNKKCIRLALSLFCFEEQVWSRGKNYPPPPKYWQRHFDAAGPSNVWDSTTNWQFNGNCWIMACLESCVLLTSLPS